MKPVLVIILIISLIGNAIGIYLFYKALKLRDEVKLYQKYHKDIADKYKALKADYPGLAAYAADNRRLLETTSPEQRKKMTILFGASITKNWDIEKYLPGKNLLNRGVGSQSDIQLLTRWSSDVLELGPGRVVLKFCSGNFNPSIDIDMMWNEYEMMAQSAAGHGIQPLPATVIPVTRGAEQYENYSITEQIIRFNERIRKFAVEKGFPLVDYFKAMADKDGFLPDNMARDQIHPNEKGYEVMAGILEPILQ